MKKLADRWLSFALKDLLVARQLLDQPEVFDMAAFHCQQAVEKSLKGLITLLDADIPRIHDLSRLYSIAGRLTSLEWEIEVLDAVNEFYIETRYPLHEDQDPLTISRRQLERMIDLAESAIAKLRNEIDCVTAVRL